ncbi:dipeptide ABC transporter ATP-binding protein (plasmid) [Natronosalvus halobius]|nr:dipeptide ABC transporter ATP-binding protein [Natronosalvus halobius]
MDNSPNTATANEQIDETGRSTGSNTLISVQDLKTHYPVKGGILNRTVGHVKAVDGVSFEIGEGETLGLVGESGCGKSTLGRTLVNLQEPTGGSVYYQGTDLANLSKAELRKRRKDIQIIFQDPASSLNPRMTIEKTITEPMRFLTDWSKEKRKSRVMELIEEVGLSEEHLSRAPHEFSGGQQQRIAIARALSVNPTFVVCDEPTSALDVSVQADILNLLQRLQDRYDLTYLFISHDLSVVRHISERIAVMYLGKFAELAPTERLFENPQHPYTRALLSSIPRANAEVLDDRIILEGDIPSPQDPPSGCRYHTRCQEYIGPVCEETEPELVATEDKHTCACHHYID